MTKEEQYAEALLRHSDPLLAAISVGFSNGEAFAIAKNWTNKPEVVSAKADLLAKHGEEHFLPSKYDQARAVWAISQSATTADDRIKAQKLYAEIMGNLAPKQEEVRGSIQQEIIFRMVGPPLAKVLDISPVKPERVKIEASK
jgi:hypothetical protein